MSLQNKTKSDTVRGAKVNAAGIWDESYCSYPGRSHRRVETEYEAWLKQDLL